MEATILCRVSDLGILRPIMENQIQSLKRHGNIGYVRP